MLIQFPLWNLFSVFISSAVAASHAAVDSFENLVAAKLLSASDDVAPVTQQTALTKTAYHMNERMNEQICRHVFDILKQRVCRVVCTF